MTGDGMKVLWLMNFILPQAAPLYSKEVFAKEGWVGALFSSLSETENLEIGCAFPLSLKKDEIIKKQDGKYTYYAFDEDMAAPEVYNPALEPIMQRILSDFKPDIIHIFGTEFPHTLAMMRACPDPQKVLIGFQGMMGPIAEHYYAGLPKRVIKRRTFRDRLKMDDLAWQKVKIMARAENEAEAISLAVHVTGRTEFDKNTALAINPKLSYHKLNESLRSVFYEPKAGVKREEGRIFLCQGNYPLKGAHFALSAMKHIIKQRPDAVLYIGGDPIKTADGLMNRIKRGSYASFLRELIRRNHLKGHVVFTGMLSADEMREQYQKASVYLFCSSVENSPNSIGEAMLLRCPVVASKVGGVPSMISEEEGILLNPLSMDEASIASLSDAVLKALNMQDSERDALTERAYKRGLKNHDTTGNRETLLKIYEEMLRE